MSVIDTLIQTGLVTSYDPTSDNGQYVMRGSNGTLYAVYYFALIGVNYLACASSTDGGVNWSEVKVAQTISNGYLSAVIDSQDKITIVYGSTTYKLVSRTFSGGAFSSESTVFDGTADTDTILALGFTTAVDSTDTVHVVWGQEFPTSSFFSVVYHSTNSGSGWTSRDSISDSYSPTSVPVIVIDSNNYLYVFWENSNTQLCYSRYTSFWTAQAIITTPSRNNSPFCVIVDSSDNIYLVYQEYPDANPLYYFKYTAATTSWGSRTVVDASTNLNKPTIARDASDNLNVFSYDYGGGYDVFYNSYNGSWTDNGAIISAGITARPSARTPLWPKLGGVSTNIPTTGYHFLYIFRDGGGDNILRYYASTDLTFPAPQTKNYSRKAAAALPANDNNLTTLFNATGYGNVLTENGIYEDQSATDQYAIVQFKNKGNSSSDNINVTWIGRTTIAPSASTVYLQIYNRNSGLWETLDSDSTTAADTPFTLTGTKTSSLSNYYDGSNWVSCRVYQLAA